MVGRITWRITTFVLIAALVPAPGVAWRVPISTRPGADDRTTRVLVHALNSVHQSAGSAVLPQIYLVFNVNVAVQTAGNPMLITAAFLGWFEEFLKELSSQPGTTVGTATEPADSILDQIDADHAHVLSMESARGLAAMPDALPFEGNPNESVPVERSMHVAITDALQAAGLDTDGTSRTTGLGRVTYENTNADGDILVTGQLIDGRIVLTKEFKPLTGGGDVGDPVRIRGTGAPDLPGTQTGGAQGGGIQVSSQTTVTNNTVAQNTVTQNTATQTGLPNTPATPAPAPAYNDTLRLQLEGKVNVITPNQNNNALYGQILIRDTYVTQLDYTATAYENLLEDPARLDGVVRDLRSAAGAVDDAFQNMQAAELAVTAARNRTRTDQKAQYETQLREAQRLEQQGNKVAADKIRQDANDSVYALFVRRQQLFYEALDANPMLGLGERGGLFSTDFLFLTLRNELSSDAPNSEYVELVRPYLVTAAEEAREEITRVNTITAADEFLEFGSPKYERTRDAVGDVGDAHGSNLPRILAEGAVGAYEMVEGASAVTTEITNFGLNVVAGGAWVIPGIGPWIAGGAAAIQVIREGNQLVIAVLDAEDARNLAGVTGYTRVITAEDRVAAEKGDFAIALGGLALEGVQAVRVVRGPVKPGAGSAAADATNTTADATGAAARNTPAATPPVSAATPPAATGSPGAAPAPSPAAAPAPAPPARAPTPFYDDPVIPPVRDKDGKLVGAGTTRVSTAEEQAIEAAGAAELKEIYDANLARARAAGVSDERIKQIIGDGDVDVDAANTLYREAIDAEGRQLTMPRKDYIALTGIEIRSARGTLTEADYAFLRNKLAADPNYLDRLPNQGRLRSSDPGAEFDPVLTPAQRDALLKDPRVAQMVDDAKKAAAANPAGPAVTANTGSVPPGSKPAGSPTRTTDPNRTTLDPNQTTLDPNKTTLDPNRTALDANRGTVDPNKTFVDPNKTTLDPNQTQLMDPNRPALPPPTASNAPSGVVPPDPKPSVPADPNQQARIESALTQLTSQLVQSLPKDRQSGMSPQQRANSIRGAMSKLGVGPQQLVSALRRQLTPRPVSMSDLGNTTATRAPGLDVSLEALGVSSGEAFKLTAVNQGTAPVQLRGEGIVVEPIIGAPTKQPTSMTSAGPTKQPSSVAFAAPVVTQTVEAFCLERVRPVAPPGTQYRVAPPAVQTQHRRLVDVLHAAQRISSVGRLRPDSEIKSYFNFVRQWSIWTRQENFDEKRFTEEFLNQTKKNVESQGVKWTDTMQTTVRKAAPGRWRDISAILDEANKPKIQAAAGTQSPPHLSNARAVDIAAGPATVAVVVRRRHQLGDWS